MQRSGRPWRDVPASAAVLLAFAFAAQMILAYMQPRPLARASELAAPPAPSMQAVLAGFDRLPAAHAFTLYLQAFDNQPGISIPFMALDYPRVAQWLSAALTLDPVGQYPLLMASQLYAQVPDRARGRFMLDYVYERFFDDPNRRWRWLAHGAIMAKHRLNDVPLALKFARAIAERSHQAPSWARQMHIFLLEDMGEFEAARILLGGLLASGTVTDTREKVLLVEALERIEGAEKSSQSTKK